MSDTGPIDPAIAIYGRDGPIQGGPGDARARAAIEAGVARQEGAPPPRPAARVAPYPATTPPRAPSGRMPATPLTIDAASALYPDGPARGGPVQAGGQQAQAAQPGNDAPFNPAALKIEGFEADPALMGEFAGTAKELGLSHAKAERLVQMHTRAVQAQYAQHEKAVTEWADETQRHFGTDLAETTAEIREAIGDSRDGQEFMRLMDWSGLGSNAAILRVLSRLARGE